MSTQATLDAIGDADFKGLCEQAVKLQGDLRIPGVALGVWHDGQAHVAGFGVTNVEHPLDVNEATLFQVGSITKTFTGTVVMQLVEQGKLDLDVPLRTYLPDLRLIDEDVAARATMRHLLTHTGGWLGDYFDDTGSGDDALARMQLLLAELPQLTPLGEVWSYNNAGFYLAGRIIEVVTGQPYETVVSELLLEPLGMELACFAAADVLTHRFAVGHHVGPKETMVGRPWALARAAHPAGGLNATVPELFKYAQLHLSGGLAPNGTRLLSEASITQMRTPQVANDVRGGYIGLTWFIRDINGVQTIQHGGGTNGQVTLLTLVPAHNLAIASLTNANLGGTLNAQVTKYALSHYLGLAEADEEPQPHDEAYFAPFLGRYEAAMNSIELSAREGSLWLQLTPKGGFPTKDSPPPPTPPPTRAAFLGEDRIVALDPPFKDAQGEFLRDGSGQITWLRIGGRIAKRQ